MSNNPFVCWTYRSLLNPVLANPSTISDSAGASSTLPGAQCKILTGTIGGTDWSLGLERLTCL
jgi:hypothetical protein